MIIDNIKKGIVIDHIQRGKGVEIFHSLGLDEVDFQVALIINASSKKMGKKDLIKIEDNIDVDLTMLGYMDSNITVNYIEGEKIVKKVNLSLPLKLDGVISCKNPRCITSEEREMVQSFYLSDRVDRKYRCSYCDHLYSKEG